jgi:uncharacterized membrane protein
MKDVRWLIVAVCLGVLIILAGCSPAPSAEQSVVPAGAAVAPADAGGAKTISFAADVKPILDKHCADCHLGGSSKGGYNLETHENALAAGRNGARIVPGNSAGSNLILRIAHDPSVKKMPPKGEALSADEVATLKAWIDQGAKWE